MGDVQRMTTYKMADGTEVFGEFSWVDGPEWFDDSEEPTEVIKEVWVLESTETVTFGPVVCSACDGVGFLGNHDAASECAACEGWGHRRG